MGLRSEEEKRPFLQERRQVDGLAGLWALLGSACGGSAVLAPALAAGAVPLGIVCGVFAYSFKRRKAACDEVIDDPPRSDYTISTHPQRDWFNPERLDNVLNPVQVRLCKLLAEGDANLRAAVRADERAQGAYAAENEEYSYRQAITSDAFMDAFVLVQKETGPFVEEMRQELCADPRWATLSEGAGSGLSHFLARDLPVEQLSDLVPASELAEPAVSLARTLPPEALTALRAASMSATVLRSIDIPRRDQDPIASLNSELRDYAKSQREHTERLHLAGQSRRAPLERLKASED
jgi:hypothetical protein